MREIESHVFTKQFGKPTTSFNDTSILGDITINDFRVNTEFTFYNCHFKKLIFDKTLVSSLKFTQCSFEQLILSNVEITDLMLFETEGGKIELKTCTISRVTLKNASKIQSIEINGGNLVSISVTESLINDLKIDGSIIKKQIELINSPSPTKENSLDTPILTFINLMKADLIINSCAIKKINVNNSELQSILIEKSQVSEVPISKTNITSTSITNSKIGDFKSYEGNLPNFSSDNSDFENLTVNSSRINNYELKRSDLIESKLKIRTLDLKASSIPSKGILKIDDLYCDNLIISHLSNLGSIEIRNSKVDKVFSFESSKLEDTSFNSLNLRDCQEIKTLNSSFTSCKFFNVQWPSNYRIYEYQKEIIGSKNIETKITKYYNPLRESYRQLVSVSNKELNKIDSLFFQKQELRIYFEIIKFHKCNSWENFQDFLVLGSNKLFSDFGQNIWKPLVWWLPIHGLLFSLIIMNFDLGIEFVNPKEHSWEVFWKGAGIYLNFLNPVHGALVENTINGRMVSIYGITDFAMRIVSGYFLYYFISATRKFHLK